MPTIGASSGCRPWSRSRGRAEGEDPAVGGDLPVAAGPEVEWPSPRSADERQAAHRSVEEDCEGEEPTVGGHLVVAAGDRTGAGPRLMLSKPPVITVPAAAQNVAAQPTAPEVARLTRVRGGRGGNGHRGGGPGWPVIVSLNACGDAPLWGVNPPTATQYPEDGHETAANHEPMATGPLDQSVGSRALVAAHTPADCDSMSPESYPGRPRTTRRRHSRRRQGTPPRRGGRPEGAGRQGRRDGRPFLRSSPRRSKVFACLWTFGSSRPRCRPPATNTTRPTVCSRGTPVCR